MRIVLDTNVLVSGLVAPYGPSGEIVRMVAAGYLILCIDARIIGEYAEVLKRPKFSFHPHQVEALLDYINASGQVTAGRSLKNDLPDADDAMFLEVALAGKAECLVTGNLKDFPAAKREGMRIVSPGDFIKFFQSSKT